MTQHAATICPWNDYQPPAAGYVLVVGAGRSGLALVRFLRDLGLPVMLSDSHPDSVRHKAALEALGAGAELGFHAAKTFENADRIVVSPGVPLDMAYLEMAKRKGVLITGELDLFYDYFSGSMVAVTGTNGKTTVTTLISEMLVASGKTVFTCGNIGTPLVEYFTEKLTSDVVVAEVSSFQLDSAVRFRPDVGVILNISDDHLDRYPDRRAYEDSKWSLLARQTKKDAAVVHQDLPGIDRRIGEFKGRLYRYGAGQSMTEAPGARIDQGRIRMSMENHGDGGKTGHGFETFQIDLAGSRLVGIHNQENIAASALACLLAGGTSAGITEALNRFGGLPHRLQFCGEVDGVRFYNDSKATNPDAVVKALESLSSPVVLIAGGRGKKTDFSCLVPASSKRVAELVAIGETAQDLVEVFRPVCGTMVAATMAEAVDMAFAAARPVKGTVLLGPACASFDMYTSYAHRGEDFMSQVARLKRGNP